MNESIFLLLVALGSFVSGLIGSLTGLGGGVLMIPLLTLVFGVNMHYAMGASLISVIATPVARMRDWLYALISARCSCLPFFTELYDEVFLCKSK
jgi:uncharacterized membrane protein YfcA